MIASSQRIDKWLWHARMLRTRSLAAKFVASGKLRVNGARVSKVSHAVVPGDVLAFALGGGVRVLRIVELADRRGPFSEARLLYEDLSPTVPDGPPHLDAGIRPPGAGRPTKRDRRRIDSLTGEDG